MFLIFFFNLLPVQLSDEPNMNYFFPTFTFLGNLMEAVPDVAHRLVTHYGKAIKKQYSFNGTLLQRVGVEGERETIVCTFLYVILYFFICNSVCISGI